MAALIHDVFIKNDRTIVFENHPGQPFGFAWSHLSVYLTKSFFVFSGLSLRTQGSYGGRTETAIGSNILEDSVDSLEAETASSRVIWLMAY